MFPDTPFPPEPIITRWGTWINAALYYVDHFDKVAKFVNQLDSTEAQCIRKAQFSLSNARIKIDLAFIKSHFECIPNAIKQLEAQGLSLSQSIAIFSGIRKNLEAVPQKDFLHKYVQTINKNVGLTLLSKISNALDGRELSERSDFIDSLSPEQLNSFKYAPLTSCDVERTFSAYKRILNDTRRRFTIENLAKHIVIHCNKL